MIDFLKKENISDDVIKKIEENNNQSSLYDLSLNEDNCLKIIKYLKDVGVLNIDLLLINEMDVFLLTFNEFVRKLKKFNISNFVQVINNDYVAIEEIYND